MRQCNFLKKKQQDTGYFQPKGYVMMQKQYFLYSGCIISPNLALDNITAVKLTPTVVFCLTFKDQVKVYMRLVLVCATISVFVKSFKFSSHNSNMAYEGLFKHFWARKSVQQPI